MTESEWRTTADIVVLASHLRTRLGEEQARRLVVRLARRRLVKLGASRLIDMLDAFAAGKATRHEVYEMGHENLCVYYIYELQREGALEGVLRAFLTTAAAGDPLLAFTDAVEGQRRGVAAYWPHLPEFVETEADQEEESNLIRELVGNPFRAVMIRPDWLTSDVLALARGIRDEKAFDRMPILADALIDADCTDEEVLSHCRRDEHDPDCWLLTLLLGRACGAQP